MRNRGMTLTGLPLVPLAILGALAVQSLAQSGAAGSISAFAGTGKAGFSGDGGPAMSADLQTPTSLAVDEAGNLFVTDSKNARLRKVTPSGTIDSVTAVKVGISDMVALDPAGTLYVTDVSTHTVRKVEAGGKVTTVAGTGESGFAGDGGPATSAKLNTPFGLAIDKQGNIFIADALNHRIRKVTPAGIISTLAGTGKPGMSNPYGGRASNTLLNFPASMALDSANNLYFSDVANNIVRKITPAGMISTVAGNGKTGFSGDGGKATNAMLNTPGPLAIGKDNSLFISDVLNYRIRKVSPNGQITTVAGNGALGAAGDGGPANKAQLTRLDGLAIGPAGNLFIADSENNRVRKISFAP